MKKTYGLFVLVCVVFGSTFLAISMGLQRGASPLFFASMRFLTAGGIILAALGATGRLTLRKVVSLAGRATFFSLFMTVGTFGCMFIAQTRVDSGFMARLDATGPLVTALLAAIILKKRLGWLHGVALVLGTAGGCLIASPAVDAELPYLILAAGSVVAYAAGNVLYPKLFSPDEDPVLISALQAVIGGVILMAAALTMETVRFPAVAIWPFVYLVIGGSVVGHTASLVLVRDAGPVFASGWLYVAPVTATCMGAMVLNESVTLGGMAGTVLALAGVFLLGRAERDGAREGRIVRAPRKFRFFPGVLKRRG